MNIPREWFLKTGKSEIFCKIKHIAQRWNEDSIIYCPVTWSQALKFHLAYTFVLCKQTLKYDKRRLSKISSSKMEKGELFCL